MQATGRGRATTEFSLRFKIKLAKNTANAKMDNLVIFNVFSVAPGLQTTTVYGSFLTNKTGMRTTLFSSI